MAGTRLTPIGFRVVEYPGGLYLHEDTDPLDALVYAVNNASIRITMDGLIFVVELDHGEDPPFSEGVAEDGRGRTLEDAFRYALGAHFGSYDDPILRETVTVEPVEQWAADLMSEDGENSEYDRALIELTCILRGLSPADYRKDQEARLRRLKS